VGRWPTRGWRELRAWIEELWPAGVVAFASFGVATVVLPDYRAAITAIMAVATAAGRFMLSQPQRRRSAATIGAAVVKVLDSRLLVGDNDPMTTNFRVTYQLSSGAPVTLRSFVEFARRGRLAEELDAGAQSRQLGEDIEALGNAFDVTATRCLLDLPTWRATSGNLVDGLSVAAAGAHALGPAGDELLMARGDDAAAAPLRERVAKLYADLSVALLTAGDAAEKLERRADPEGAAQRSRDRATDAAQTREDRRCAHRALLQATKYVAAWRDGGWRERLASWPLVLTVTVTTRRATILRHATEELLRSQRDAMRLARATEFDFAALPDVRGAKGPLGEIWQVKWPRRRPCARPSGEQHPTRRGY
jgi:hypothetical protein